jgi:glycosyltransferase involved in cell wall biosynthesis
MSSRLDVLVARAIGLKRLQAGALMATSAGPIVINSSAPPAPSHDLAEPELSVVMPCLNEERTVGKCVEKAVRTMRERGIAGEVVVVDNGSADRSVEVAEHAGARAIRHSLRGYGNALRRGFAEARGRFILMGDSDDSYDFTDLPRFVEGLRSGADLVMGNRFAGEIKPGAMPWLHKWIGNPFLTWFLNVLFHTGVGDVYCGMRGFRKEAIDRLRLHMPGMEMACEMVLKSAVAKLRIEEIPITLWPDGRDRPPHLRSFRDGWRTVRFLLMCSPLFLFILPGLALTLLGLITMPVVVLLGYGTPDYIFGPNFLYTASLVSLTGWHLIVFGFLAKLHTHMVDPVFHDPRMDQLTRWFKVERGIALGAVLMAVGVGTGLPVLLHWVRTLELPVPAQWVFGGTMFLLGLETMFLAFLVAILDLRRESTRSG